MANTKIEKSLKAKFVSLILYNSILTTIVLVIIFGAWRYYDLYSRYKTTFNTFSSEQLVGLEQSLWLMDEMQTRRQLNELKLVLDIDYVELISQQNEMSSLGVAVPKPILSKSLKVTRTEGNRTFELGKLILQLDRSRILKKLFSEIIPILVIALLTVIAPLILNSVGLQKIILLRMDQLIGILNQRNTTKKLQALNAFIKKSKRDEIDNLAQEIYDYQKINETLNANLLAQQYQLEAIFDNTELYLGLMDSEGNLLNINKTALTYTQKNKKNVLFTPVWGHIWDDYDESVRNKIRELANISLKGSVVSEELILHKNQTDYHFFINFVPLIKNDEVELVIVEGQDLTKIRRWEKQLSIQVKLLKSLVAEPRYLDSLNTISSSINHILPAGVHIHIIEREALNFNFSLLSGGFNHREENVTFVNILKSVFSANFSLDQPVDFLLDYSEKDENNLADLATSLNINKLYITPIKTDQNFGNPVYVIFSLPHNYFINSFIKQTASMCSSLVELTIAKEQQSKLTEIIENNLTDVMNNSLDGIVVMDEHGMVVSNNERFSQLVKKPSNQISGKYFWQLPVDMSKEKVLSLIGETHSGRNQFSKFILSYENELTKHCEITFNQIGAENNKQYYAFIQDRTDHYQLLRELEQQNQFINAVLNNTSEGIIACDANLKINVFNQAMKKIHGKDQINNDTKKWSEYYQLYDLDGKTILPLKKNPVYEIFHNDSISYPELMIKNTDESMHRVFCSGSRFYSNNGQMLGAVVSIRDITKEFKTQETLKNYQLHLEQLVEKRTEAMALANKELEAFAYSVSHDLRAPLRSINGFAQMFEEDYQDIIDKNGRDYLNRIKKNATQMGLLIEDMLTLSKISRAEMKIELIDISQLAYEIMDFFQENHPDLNINIQSGITEKGDPGLVKILLQNILENAVKYSQNKKDQSVSITQEKIDDIKWVIITDNGIGFDEKYAQKIFQPFKRLHGNEFEGTGIGLSSVKRVINRHQGEIIINSKPNKGTRVQFHLGEPEF